MKSSVTLKARLRELRPMVSLMALTDKVLREAGLLRAEDSMAQEKQAAVLVDFLDSEVRTACTIGSLRSAAGRPALISTQRSCR